MGIIYALDTTGDLPASFPKLLSFHRSLVLFARPSLLLKACVSREEDAIPSGRSGLDIFLKVAIFPLAVTHFQPINYSGRSAGCILKTAIPKRLP